MDLYFYIQKLVNIMQKWILSLGVDLINVPLLDSSVEDINESFEMINYHEFDELMDIYKNQFEKGIIDKITKDKLTRISVIPHSNIIDWFHLRSKYISYKLFYESKDLNPIDFIMNLMNI